MNHENLLPKLKKDIRSLLISSKLGLEPEQLRRDYVSMLGHPLPLTQLGFTNIMDMVVAMPDVVAINIRQDGTMYLKAVGDESTQNIEELVAKQRNTKVENLKLKREQRSRFPRHSYYPSPQVFLPRRGLVPPSVPAQLRAQLLQLLSMGPIRLCDLEASFLRCFGHPLRVQNFGFYSIHEMLSMAADLVVIQQDRLGSFVSLRMMPWLPAMLIGHHNFLPYGTKKVNWTRPDSGVQRKTETRVPVSPPKPTLPKTTVAPIQKDSVPVSNKPEVGETNHELPPEDGQLFEKRVKKLEEEFCQQIVENGVAGTISQELKEKLRKVVSQAGDGLSVHDVPAEYKRLHGEDLPLLQSGFVSVTQLIDAMSNTFDLKPVENDTGQHWIVSVIQDGGAPQTDSKETESLEVKQPSSSYYLSCGGSLWEDKEDGAGDEAVSLADRVHVLEPIVDVKSQRMASLLHCSSSVPPDALRSQQLKKPARLGERDMVQVLVEHVESPGSFYVSFCDSEEARETEDMMIEMRRCYKCPEVSERYCLPEQFVRRGQVCCVCPEGMWFYRVVIHQILSPTHVEVYFADFGNMSVVPRNSLKFLKSRYSDLPAQAVPSALTGIKPSKGSWTPEATALFQKLCCSNPLVGVAACYTGDVLQLYLCDTRTDTDVYIHKVLLSEGHGVACSPSVSEELCTRSIPVTMYLGEGTLDLPEIEEPSLTSNPVSLPPKAEEVDLPPLELIEDSDCNCHVQDEDRSFDALLDDQSVTCSEEGPTVTAAHPPSPPSSTPTPAAPPDLIQNTPTFKVDILKSVSEAPPAPSNLESSFCCPPPQQKQNLLTVTASYVLHTAPFWSSPDPEASAYGQGFLLNRLKTGFSFPVFGARSPLPKPKQAGLLKSP